MGSFYLLDLSGDVFTDVIVAHESGPFYLLGIATLVLVLGFLGRLYDGRAVKKLRAANQNLAGLHAELQKSRQRMEQILDNITDGFFALDDAWCFTELNRPAERFLQKSHREMIGCNAWEYFSGHVGEQVQERFRQAAETGSPVTFESFYTPLNRWIQFHLYPFEDGFSVYFNDITERKEYEQRLIEAKEDAEQQAEIKSNLMANMSHEIRTPLTSIIGFSSVLEQEVAGEHQDFAKFIGQNGRCLMETLNSVLDLARLEHGGLACTLERVTVGAEVAGTVELLRPRAQDRGLELRIETPSPDVSVPLDRVLLNRVLNNLVNNAIKFTHEGRVTVSVRADDEHVCVAVADTGIGISASFLPHLFEKFRQESTGAAQAYDGNGLGLAISRRLVDTMGGTIEVDSEKGVGTTFTVRLPRATERVEAA